MNIGKIIVMIMLLTGSVAGIGVTPSEVTLCVNSGETITGKFWVSLNSEISKPIVISGTPYTWIKTPETVQSVPGDNAEVIFTVTAPNESGLYQQTIHVHEQSQNPFGGMSVMAIVKGQINVKVPCTEEEVPVIATPIPVEITPTPIQQPSGVSSSGTSFTPQTQQSIQITPIPTPIPMLNQQKSILMETQVIEIVQSNETIDLDKQEILYEKPLITLQKESFEDAIIPPKEVVKDASLYGFIGLFIMSIITALGALFYFGRSDLN